MTTTNQLSAGELELYDNAVPDLSAGTYTINVNQQVHPDLTTTASMLSMAGSFQIEVTGPKDRLSPRDVLGVFPAAGSREASDLRVPHIALRRRTLPWEREVFADKKIPWMALLLLKVNPEQSEDGGIALEPKADGTSSGAKLIRASGGQPDTLRIPGPLLTKLAPRKQELRLLSHVRRVSLEDTEGEFAGDDDGFVAMVLGNRLPAAGHDWIAALVSLEGKHAAIDNWGASTHSLTVLYYWAYHTAALGGDFQVWAQGLHYNGGVHLLGHVPDEDEAKREPKLDGIGGVSLDHRERDGSPERGIYHGPAMAIPMARSQEIILTAERARQVAAGKYDASYAAAFELGRLLAMSDRGILQALIGYRRRQYEVHREKLFLPKALPNLPFLDQGKMENLIDRLNGSWFMDQILSQQDLLSNPLDQFGNGLFHDPTGLLGEFGNLPGLQPERLGAIGLDTIPGLDNLPGLDNQVPGFEGGLGSLDLDHEIGLAESLGVDIQSQLDLGIADLEAGLSNLMTQNFAAKLEG
ncbi:hypothetical protein G6O69_22280 [Pseudenhygromyxa sp. WMMC2535]|uniref:hypothetical protein n=1 Tax=Pseudenhygromyxa sp. WMMC2535 TaxID=2712867 RepID=UPI001557B1C0|nr:hypothetical protein [Pseudenhygromyxa sp. WMMC2535]NVB40585.1 hypothetical protein [Pseudenhygromyxa sp. WMMC2535]